MNLLYVLPLIFGIRASYFEGLDLLSFDIRSPLNDMLNIEEVAIPKCDKIEDLLTSFQPQNLEISNSPSPLQGFHEIGDIVRLRDDPYKTFAVQTFFEYSSICLVADEGTLKRYYFHAYYLEKCPKYQIDEYNEVRSTTFPIVGRRFRMDGEMYKIMSVSFENRELWIEHENSCDLYQYRFNEQDNAMLLNKLPIEHANKKIALQSQDTIDHSPIPTPTSTEPTSREVVSAASNEKLEEEPWKYFERNQLVQKVSTKKIYIFKKIDNGRCLMTPLDDMSQRNTYLCHGLRAVASVSEEVKKWNKSESATLCPYNTAYPGDTVLEASETSRSFILVSSLKLHRYRDTRCLLTDKSGTKFYMYLCKELLRYRH